MNLEPKIVYQNDDILVIDKPSGLLVHPYKHSSEPTVTFWVTENFPSIKGIGENDLRPGMVHRLDRDTSGIMLIAKNQQTFEYLKDLFQNHQIKKTYLALVFGHVENKEGIIDKPFGINNGSVKRSTHSDKMVKDAITEYTVKKYILAKSSERKFTFLEVRPRTGRTHQIRVHLFSIGHPVMGDIIYSSKKQIEISRELGLSRLFLHAESIEFTMPNGERVKFSTDIPEDMGIFLMRLSGM